MDWAAKWAQYSPDKVAFKEYERQQLLSFGRLNGLGNSLACHFEEAFQIKKGDRIAILAENCLEYLVLLSVAQKIGCILVPLNYRLASDEIGFMLNDANPKLIIVEDKFREKVQESTAVQNIPHRISMEDLTGFCEAKAEGVLAAPFQGETVNEEDPVFILYTSGTTGFPKGALYTHKMLFWNSINTALSLTVNTESRTVNCMPPFHTGGWNVLVTPFFHHGAYTCLVKSFEAEQILEAIQAEHATIFMGVPTMLKMMAALPAFAKADLSSLEYVIVGGEPMPIPLIKRWHQKGVPIRQGFGMTEVGPNLTSLHHEDAIRKMGSIGRPNFYVETKIVDEHGQTCQPGHAGELLLRGPMVTPGYWKNEEATQKAFKVGWFCTGDRVLQDEEGYLFVIDRIKNMYISGGENVYPAEIERILVSHPLVSEAAVVGVPDPKWGESGRAFIVKKGALSEEELIAHCQSKLAKFKVPKSIFFMEQLPKNDTQKVDRTALRELVE